MKTNYITSLLAGIVLLGIFIVGCNQSPIDSTMNNGTNAFAALGGGSVQFSARIANMDQIRRMLTFAEKPDSVIANQNCEIVRRQNGIDIPVEFSGIKLGDSIQVFGERQQSRLINAYRLRIYADSGSGNQIAGRVRTMDMLRLMLTFVGKPDTIIANQSCQMMRLQNGGETPIHFWEIKIGDSLQISGSRYMNGYMYANKIKVCSDKNNCQYDVAFRDTIVTVDYSVGAFTVKNRTETIIVDSSTLIFGVIARYFDQPKERWTGRQQQAAASGNGSPNNVMRKDTILSITDLNVGDIIEVRAKIINENTLLAVSITLAACNDIEKKCVEFTASLASVDVEARIVTFDGLPWIGTVCNGANLVGLSGEVLTLGDFLPGDYVVVKGFPLVGDTLRICQMTKTNP